MFRYALLAAPFWGGVTLICLARWRRQAEQILRWSDSLGQSEPKDWRRRLRELTGEVRGGRSPRSVLPEVYSLVCCASWRVLKQRPFPEQVMGAIGLFAGQIVELQTGEGKTLAATLPAVLRALAGAGCHVVTANDYLAERDAQTMGDVYAELGLSTGCILSEMDDAQRREAYAKDITYGTAAQFGFDFLRDRLRRDPNSPYAEETTRQRPHGETGQVQRGQYCAIVDEADSVLIDDAVTPLLIGLPQGIRLSQLSLFEWASRTADLLKPGLDFVYEPERRRTTLTRAGCCRVLLLPKPQPLDTVHAEQLYDHVETALTARVGYHRDRDYVIDGREVVIVDDSTGRKMPGRKWQRGLHQAVEAKEHLPITDHHVHAAQITVQSYFRRYAFLCGMTGTAVPAQRELRSVFRVNVSSIPTHRPCIRRGLPPRVFPTRHAKHLAIIEEIVAVLDRRRAVLVGTPSVAESEALSALLKQSGITHALLNARQHYLEAEIVARAGWSGTVTIATNMAGRGTDIVIDETVRQAGGLHVIAAAMHSARRIDRQLIGRTARQGDPGSYRFFLSLEDELLQALPNRQRRRVQRLAQSNEREIGPRHIGWFRQAQRRLERRHARARRQLLKSEKQKTDRFREIGLDPFLECPDDDL